MLLRAAKEKLNVVFESVIEDVTYFFGKDGLVLVMDRASHLRWPFVADPDTLYIMDAGGKGIHREPFFVNAFTVVTASPNEKHYGQFVKEIGLDAQFFLPDWTLEDLLAVLPFVDERRDDDVDTDAIVEERFSKIGGVPRFVFGSKKNFDTAFSALRGSLAEISTFDLSRLMAKEKKWQEVPNFVFTLRSHPPNFDDESTSVEMASLFVEQQLPLRLNENNFHQLVSFFNGLRYPVHILIWLDPRPLLAVGVPIPIDSRWADSVAIPFAGHIECEW